MEDVEGTGKAPDEEKRPERQLPEVPPERPYTDLISEFMGKTGMTREQARRWLAAKMLEAGVDPYRDAEEAARFAQELSRVVSMFPDLPLTSRVKDAVYATGLAGAASRASDPDERIARLMERFMPYAVLGKMMSSMMGPGDMQQPREDPRVAKLEAQLEVVARELERRPIEELKAQVSEIRQALADLRAAPREEPGSKVAEKIEGLERKIAEQQRSKEMEELKREVDGTVKQMSEKIEALKMLMSQGAPKNDVLGQATELLNAMGSFYKGFGDVAKTMGFEPKDEKLSGDRWDKVIGLGKKAIEVIGDAVKYGGVAPPKQQVKQMPPPEAPAEPPRPQAPETPPETKPPQAPETPPEAKPPETKPEAPPEAPAETHAPETSAETPPEAPSEAPAGEAPPERPPES